MLSRPWSNTTSDHINGSFAPRHAPLGSFYAEYHVTVSVAIKAERGGERGATRCQMVQRNEDSIRLTDPSPAF